MLSRPSSGPCQRCLYHLVRARPPIPRRCSSTTQSQFLPSPSSSCSPSASPSASRSSSCIPSPSPSPAASWVSIPPARRSKARLRLVQPPSEHPAGRSALFYPPFYPPPVGLEGSTLRYQRRYEADRKAHSEPSDRARRKREILWAEPTYRMRVSPKRQCIVTRQRLPREFMIGLRPSLFENRLYLLPHDLLLSPGRAIAKPRMGLGYYVVCHKNVVPQLLQKGPHLGFFSRRQALGTMKIPENLSAMVYSQLCQRVVQEARLLARQARKTGVEGVLQPLTTVQADKVKAQVDGAQVSGIDGTNDDNVKLVEQSGSDSDGDGIDNGNGNGNGNDNGNDNGNGKGYRSRQQRHPTDVDAVPRTTNWTAIIDLSESSERAGCLMVRATAERAPASTYKRKGTWSRTWYQPELPVYTLTSLVPADTAREVAHALRRIMALKKTPTLTPTPTTTTTPTPTNTPTPTSTASPPLVPDPASTLAPTMSTTSTTPSPTPVLTTEAALTPTEGSANLVALQSWPTPLDAAQPGYLAVRLSMALWRLACWHGYRWKEIEVDRSGKRI